MDPIARIARHEAAHAVVVWALGGTVASVTVSPNGGGLTEHEPLDAPAHSAMAALAGPLQHSRDTGQSFTRRVRTEDDEKAWLYSKYVAAARYESTDPRFVQHAQAIVASLAREAALLLDRYAAQHERLAAVLVTRRSISGLECHAILGVSPSLGRTA